MFASRTRQLAALAPLICGWHAGCAPPARLHLVQPHLPGRQGELHLQSDWADFAREPGRPDRVLLAFPLPGARRGDKHYYVYLQFPAASGTYRVDDEHQDRSGGFLKQVGGLYAGSTAFRDIMLTVKSTAQACHGQFVIVCEDGTGLEGTFNAARNDWQVRQFEERHLPAPDNTDAD